MCPSARNSRSRCCIIDTGNIARVSGWRQEQVRVPGRVAVGVDINATHHRAVREGVVTGTATAVHVGRGTAAFDVVIADECGRRVCSSRITCQLRDAPPA